MKLRYQRVSYRATTTRQLERMLEYVWDASRNATLSPRGEWRPPVDVYQTAGEVTVIVELAGMREDEIEATLFDDMIVVQGERKPAIVPGEDLTYHEAGVRYGRYRAEVLLPVPVNTDAVEARYENGFLIISLPKQTVRLQATTTGE